MTATVSNTNITKATDSTPKEATSTIASQDVGLLFVREYYTFLNKKPHRLHAFYNKDSYFIRGDEGENVQTYQGQEEIRKKIEELNFEDCKVLVTQVDSQMSANDGILIQVLGEMCVMDGPSQKFSQTFFLAPQPNGYYVLNDIFRFLKDEVDIDYYTCEDDQQQQQNKKEEVISEQAPSVREETKQEQLPEPIATTKVEEPVKKQEQDEKSVEPKVEEKETEKENIEEVKQVSQPKSSDEKKKRHHHPSSHKEEIKINGTVDHSLKETNEKATPATTTETSAAASPALTKPSAPKTWANVTANDPSKWGTQVSEAKGSVSPVIANVQTPKEATPQQPTPQQPTPQQAIPQQPTPQQPSQQQQQQQSQQQSNQSNKEQRKDEVTNIFVKNVFSNINQDQLQEAFSKFGSIRSLNIVSNRNCAFVDFTTPEACQKALAQHKVNVGSSVVLAEERRQHGSGGRYGGNRQQQNSGSGSGGNYRHQQGGNYRRNTGGGSGNNSSGRNTGSGGSSGNKSRSGGSGNNQK